MNRDEIFAVVGLPKDNLDIEKVELVLWGSGLVVHFVYGLHTLPAIKRFRLVFERCRNITWEITEDEMEEDDIHANIMGIFLGKDHYQAPIVITTLLFELVVLYDAMKIEKDW